MNSDKLNQWLSLLANIGVLVGIVFLSLEISQSNRIAIREARSELQSTRADINASVWESEEIAEFMVKLQSSEPVLTPTEEYRAYSFALLQINQTISLNLNNEAGFIPEEALTRNMQGAQNALLNLPGLAPFLRQGIEQLNLTEVVFGEGGESVMRSLGETIIRLEQIGAGLK